MPRRGPKARATALVLAVVASALGCGRAEVTPSPAPMPATASTGAGAATTTTTTSTSTSTTLGGAEAGGDTSWTSLVRDEQWDAAWKALDALTDEEKARPEVRYARGRVALARGDAAAALPLFADLEGVLPLLGDDIARRRAEAKLVVGPFAEAGEWFAMRVSPGPQLDAARAFEKARDSRRARAAADRVIASERRSRNEEAEARALRVRLADPVGDGERADAR
ncbi:MAG TPA: hypothetical protein VH044_07270, partial [Polyangiaceae bacterium]|nr:hypothetical protein [Polyangiaceae bacterium]